MNTCSANLEHSPFFKADKNGFQDIEMCNYCAPRQELDDYKQYTSEEE